MANLIEMIKDLLLGSLLSLPSIALLMAVFGLYEKAARLGQSFPGT